MMLSFYSDERKRVNVFKEMYMNIVRWMLYWILTFYMTRPQQTLHALADFSLSSTSLSSWRPIIWPLGDADSRSIEHQTTPYTCYLFPISDILWILFFFERNKIILCNSFLYWLTLQVILNYHNETFYEKNRGQIEDFSVCRRRTRQVCGMCGRGLRIIPQTTPVCW